MNAPTPAQVLGRVTLVTGKEEFLSERTVASVRAAVKEYDAESEFSESIAADLTVAGLSDLAAPSLFSSVRCIVIRLLENLPEDAVADLIGYCANPVDDVALVLLHSGGQKGSGTLNKLRKLAAVTEIKSVEIKTNELPKFVTAEVKRYGGKMDSLAAGVLIEAIGPDLRSLSGAAHQLVNDFPSGTIGESQVKQYFGGRAEAKSFAVADAAFSGKRQAALEELRWALDGGMAGVLVTSAFAASARGLAKLSGAPRGAREADVARDVGVPPWKVRTLREQLRGWEPASLAQAIRAIAQADADIKGAASDPAFTLERLVLTVTQLRGR